jgi:hypothetical protein
VVTFELENTVTENMSEIEINSLHSNISATYGVQEDKLEMNMNYQAKGSLYLYPSMYDEEMILDSMKTSISVTLNISKMTIEVTFNNNDFVVYYSISSTTYEEALEISNQLSANELVISLNYQISHDALIIDLVTISDEIILSIKGIINGNQGIKSLEDANCEAEKWLEERFNIVKTNGNLQIKIVL